MVGYYNQGAQEIEQLQTLYLMNPGYPGYDHTPNILLLNSAAASVPPSLNPVLLSPAPPSTATNNIHQLLGIPLLPASSASHPTHYISSLQPFNSNLNPRLWMPPHLHGLGQQQQQAGLSLSLSPLHRVPIDSASETELSNTVWDMPRFWMGSKYLKVAQQLLEEVVSAGNESKGESTKGSEAKCQLRSTKAADLGKSEKASNLTTAERQDLHIKLVNMLEEVEQRYKLYHHHIQTIVFSFEAAMGSGAARTYTALALQTISKQFRCLKDVISAQIRGNAKSMGEEAVHNLGEDKSTSGSRLRLIDQQLKQKKAFQQIGMVQHNAWRPQRGLPERSVSILRAWLFEHFLHPYPKHSDKQLLAKQTGLTRSQVSNWFINARVRLWKPMVEEMYMEELKGDINIGDENSNTNGESTSKSNASTHEQDIFVSPTKIDRTRCEFTPPGMATRDPKRVRSSESAMHSNTMQHSMNMEFGVMDSSRDEGELMIKFGMGLQGDEDESHGRDTVMSRRISNGDAGLRAYPAGQVERLISEELLLLSPRLMMNKSVGLTLGLPHHDDNNLRVSAGGHGQSFLSTTDDAHEQQHFLQVGRRVELSGGLLNRDPISYSSSFYI